MKRQAVSILAGLAVVASLCFSWAAYSQISRMRAGEFASYATTGTNGFSCETNGCRVDLGTGSSDYLSSDGTFIKVAGPVAYAAPLIQDDANTLCHLYFDGAQIRDTKGCAWTMAGTVPQTAGAGQEPARAGPFSDTNYYYLDPSANGNDVLDFATTFTAVLVVKPTNISGTKVLWNNGTLNTNGTTIEQVNDTVAFFWGLAHSITAGGTVGAAQYSAICIGFESTKGHVELNQAATAGTVGALVAATSARAYLGRYVSAGNAYDGELVEAWFTTTPWSDALCGRLVTKILNAF